MSSSLGSAIADGILFSVYPQVAVIDDGWGGDALVLFDNDTSDVTVVQPNEDGSYWRKVVRNKMHRMREMRRASAAKKWIKKEKGLADDAEVDVLSSWGPYITTAGNVMGITTMVSGVTQTASHREYFGSRRLVGILIVAPPFIHTCSCNKIRADPRPISYRL